MSVLISYRWRFDAADRLTLNMLTRAVVREALAQAGMASESEVSVLFVGDEEIRQLNAKYRGIDRATDVLSFAMTEGEAFPGEGGRLLGDVVVSVETALRQARRGRRTLRREIAVLLVHGTLHLLGYDHEAARGGSNLERRTRQMRQAERDCLDRLEERLVI